MGQGLQLARHYRSGERALAAEAVVVLAAVAEIVEDTTQRIDCCDHPGRRC